ncbi:MAG: RNHCP domain-containing protein [Candidatus Buchananbacteria bacterium]
MSQKFQKTVEDFNCEHCQAVIKGNGYTNHCSRCLWSKHVDINPGDRLATCGGLMMPQELILEHGEQQLIHRCRKCGQVKKNKVSANDDFEAILKLMKNVSKI